MSKQTIRYRNLNGITRRADSTTILATITDMAVFLSFLSLSFYLVWQRIFPYLFDDEYGVLGAAAALAGLDWTTPPGMPFYGFVLSIFLAPFYKLNLEPTLLYRVALSINGLLVALSAVMALHLLRRLVHEMTELTRVLVVIAAFCYPSVLFYAGLALGETTLLFSFMLSLFGLGLLFDHQRKFHGAILMGLGLGLAPYAHTRGLAFWLAVAPVLLWALRGRWITLGPLAVMAAVSLPIVTTLASLKSWLTDNFYSSVRTGTGSATEFASTKIVTAFSPERWPDLALTAYGQFAYLASASFGLVLIGLVAIIAVLKSARFPFARTLGKQEQNAAEIPRVAAAAFIGLSFLIMFALSVISLAGGSHANHLFYGRYNEVMSPALLITGLIFLDIKLRRRSIFYIWIIGSILISTLSIFFISYFPEHLLNRSTFWTQITGWFPHIQGNWKINPIMITIGVALGGIIIIISSFSKNLLFFFIIAIFFLASTIHAFSGQHFLADRGGIEYARLSDMHRAELSGYDIYAVQDANWGFLPAERLQIALPYSFIHFEHRTENSAIAIFDAADTHCNDSNTLATLGTARLCVRDSTLQAMPERPAPPPDLRTAPPARIRIHTEQIQTGGPLHRACAFAARFFYTGWARYCLPAVTVSVAREGLTGHEHQRLGVFITDPSGQWQTEWRTPLDGPTLARGETVTVRVPVRFPANLPGGDYQLHVTVVDASGWDWRSTETLSFHVE